MTKRLFAVGVLATVAFAAATSSAWAQEGPDDPTYPLTSLTSMLDGPIAEGSDPRNREYALESHVGAVDRLLADDIGPQDVVDGAGHMTPTVAGTSVLATGDSRFMPDWNRNGEFGDAGDYDVENSDQLVTAPFRYPCIGPDYTVTYRTVSGKCAAPGKAKFLQGEARRLRVVDSRGLELAATLFLPHTALRGGRKHSAIVFAPGWQSRQADYYMYSMTFAGAGHIVLTYDPAGQGDSEGTATDLLHSPGVEQCFQGGACRDFQDMMRWFTGGSIKPVFDTSSEEAALSAQSAPRMDGRHNPAYAPAGENRRNPVLSRVDRKRIGIIGHSMGSQAVTNYLLYYGRRSSIDGRRLPPVAAAVPISGFIKQDKAVVPTQLQTNENDVPAPEFFDGPLRQTDGPVGAKTWYDDVRASRKGTAPLQYLVFEGGSHFDFDNVLWLPKAAWTAALSTSYASDWFGCYLQKNRSACKRSIKPQPHLSRAFASEYDLDGPGPRPSRCMVVPTEVAPAQIQDRDGSLVKSLAGQPTHDCRP